MHTDSYQELALFLGKQIKKEMEIQNIEQKDLANQLNISQPTISNIINGKTNISMKKIFLIMEALGMNPLNEISHFSRIHTNDEARNVIYSEQSLSQSQLLISDPANPLFNGQTGLFHCYFFSTNTNEDFCHHGYLNLKPVGDQCFAEVQIPIPSTTDFKYYTGSAYLSPLQRAIYIVVSSHQLGEICSISYSLKTVISRKNVQCIMALALTVSSGVDSRLPTVHRLFLSREELTPEQLDLIQGQLLLNKSQIQIEAEQFKKMCQDLHPSDQFVSFFNANKKEKVYYEIEESTLKPLEEQTKTYFHDLCKLRKYSNAPKNNKINEHTIDKIYRKLF